MGNPTRFPAGISTLKPNHILNTFPSLPSNSQAMSIQEMLPYIAGQWKVTSTSSTVGAGVYNAVGSTLINGYNGGSVSLAVTTASGGKAALALNGNIDTGQQLQLIPGNQLWFNCQVAHNSTFLTDATTVSRYGFVDISDVTGTITNGVYFEKNAAAGGALNLIIKNTGLTGSTVTTTINNVADVSKPSGIYGDTSSSVGTLTTAGSSNKYTSIAVATAGSGYAMAPLIRTLGANAASPYAGAYCQVANGALTAPYLTHIGGTGYTTFTNEVNHWVDLSLYYNGKGTLYVGVNGKTVVSIGPDGTTALAAGGTATSGNSFFASNTNMTASIAPVLPRAGSFDNIMPMTSMFAGIGYALNTNATNIMFCDSVQVGVEYN